MQGFNYDMVTLVARFGNGYLFVVHPLYKSREDIDLMLQKIVETLVDYGMPARRSKHRNGLLVANMSLVGMTTIAKNHTIIYTFCLRKRPVKVL